jgi:hypothetical protein
MQYSEAGFPRPTRGSAEARGGAACDDPLGCKGAGWVRGVVQPRTTAEASTEKAGSRMADVLVYRLPKLGPQGLPTRSGELVILPREC